jgi:signal transduction histidine kinase
MSKPMEFEAQLAAVAARLSERRDALLQRWRQRVAADTEVTTADSLSRSQFVDHVPEVLQAMNDALRAGGQRVARTAAENVDPGGSHGQHRWQQGYSLLELMREWSHLQMALTAEMQLFIEEHPGLDLRAINLAYQTIAELCLEGMNESARTFDQLQKTEAAGQVHDLDQSLRAMRALERRQAEILRGAAHDLRGNIGLVSNATAALTIRDLPEERRVQLLDMAQRAVQAHSRLLSDLMDLARLQAGYERRSISAVDISAVLNELCRLALPLAQERGLYLHFEGPNPLTVEADPLKVSRIVQNLLLNALHYTREGGVTVRWSSIGAPGAERWRVEVEDSGPGVQRGPAAPLASAIEDATHEAAHAAGTEPSLMAIDEAGTPPHASGIDPPRQGEGIGLSIVKRLCELLDATLEMQSAAGQGTVFAVIFPRRYAAAK